MSSILWEELRIQESSIFSEPLASVKGCLFENIHQHAALVQFVKSNQNFIFINPDVLGNRFNLSLALLRAFAAQRDGKMVAKSIPTQVLCSIVSTKNIRSALKALHVTSSDRASCILGFDGTPEQYAQLEQVLDGATPKSLDHLIDHFNADKATQLYKLSPFESQNQADIFKSIGNRIALGDTVFK